MPRENPNRHVRDTRPSPPGEERIAYLGKQDGNFEIYSVKPDGTGLMRVTNHEAGDHYPRWIAGGRQIAFYSQRSREDGAWDRWECDWNGENLTQSTWPASLYQPKAGEFPEISANGGYVLFVEEVDGDQEIFRGRSGGGGEKQLTFAKGLDYRGRWSPDGNWILFGSERDGNQELYIMDINGENLKRLTNNPGNDSYHQWSPDGSWIAFASDMADGETYELYLMRPDGSDVRRLTHNEAPDEEPSWSPDGTHIAYRSDESGASEIWVLNVNSLERKQITRDSGYAGEPVWSPPAP